MPIPARFMLSLVVTLFGRIPFGGGGGLPPGGTILAIQHKLVKYQRTNDRHVRSRPVTGVGLDLLEIDRLAVALDRRPRLAERLFTEAERAFAAERGEPARHLAARFCAKEAVAKALALRDGDWHEVEVVGGGDSAPGVRLTGRAAARAAELGVEVAISLTHSKGMAGAVAVLK
jgi:holo-[acyl-carrier protein] synthase